jgi:acyl-coenzyme A synthetase/AMP-(fatty) acid ligase
VNPLDALRIPVTARVADAQSADPGLTWAEFLARAGQWAAAQPPFLPRRAYGIQAANGVDTLAAICGVFLAGGVPALFPPGMAEDQVQACLSRVQAAALYRPAAGWLELGPGGEIPRPVDIIMHSSGSTGVPKSIGIRLEAMRENALDVGKALGLGPDDTHLGVMSQCYMSGLYNAFALPLVLGGAALSGPVVSPLNAGFLLDALVRRKPTVLWCSPLLVRLFARSKAAPVEAFASLRMVISCTAPLPAEDKDAFEARFGRPVLQSYGLCETLILTVEDPADPGPGTVGKPVGRPGDLVLDSEGQLVAANRALLAGYLEEGLRLSLAGLTSYSTGDLGRFDGQGNLHVLGRVTETINRDGVKFSPGEVEAQVLAVPGVGDCAVIGVPDSGLGVRVVAWVVARDVREETLHEHLRRVLPAVKCPHEVRFVPDLPRTANAKVDRVALRAMTSVP